MPWRGLVCTLLLASLSACAFRKDDKREDAAEPKDVKTIMDELQREQDANAGVLTSKDVTYEFVPQPEPHQYKLVISWSVKIPLVEVSLNGKLIGESDSGSFEASVVGARNYLVELQSKNGEGRDVSIVRKELTAPKDIVIGAHLYLNESAEFVANRIFVARGTIINTDGRDLTLEADFISFDLSRILTFEPGQSSGNRLALENGSIRIKARKIVGDLMVTLRGLDGQNGKNGADLIPPGVVLGPGANGVDGADGRVVLDAGTCNNGSPPPPPGQSCRPPKLICYRAPTNGSDGGKGSDGVDGQNGHNGGNTGNLFLETSDYSEFRFTGEVQVGKAGAGGKRQPEFPGGAGGKAGALEPKKKPFCPAAVDGQPGPSGRVSVDGRDGEPGKRGRIVLPEGPNSQVHFRLIDL